MIIKSGDAVSYEAHFAAHIPAEARQGWGSLQQGLILVTILYATSRRPDLGVDIIKDQLQHTGVIANDRYIVEQHEQLFVDKNNPRAEIFLFLAPVPLKSFKE